MYFLVTYDAIFLCYKFNWMVLFLYPYAFSWYFKIQYTPQPFDVDPIPVRGVKVYLFVLE